MTPVRATGSPRNRLVHLGRGLAFLGAMLSAAPLGLWLADPERVLVHPVYDATGILNLVYIVLGSAGAGLEAPRVVLLFYTILVEEWFAGVLVGRFGISDGAASILLGATVAVAVTPLKGVVDRLVSRGLSVPGTEAKARGAI